MEYHKLGNAGIEISKIGLLWWAIGGASSRAGEPAGCSGSNGEEPPATEGRARDFRVSLYDMAGAHCRGREQLGLMALALSDVSSPL